MADVYCAEDTQLGRKVALKLLYRRFAEDAEFVERFRREASSAAGLQHPNVVQVFDRGAVGRHLLHRDGVPRGAQPQGGRARARRARSGARGRPRDPDPQGGAVRAPARDRAPRHQAAQRDRRRRGAREGHRLRDRPRRRVRHDRDRLDHGHRAVPVARAGAGPAGRRARRPLLDRDRALRAAHGHAAVRRRVGGDDRAQAGVRGADPADGAQPGGAAGARRGGAARAAQGPRATATRTPTRSSRRSSARCAGYAEPVVRRRGPGRAARGRRTAATGPGSRRSRSSCSRWRPRPSARTCCSRRSRRRCPNVVGKRTGAATQQLQDSGFEVEIVPIQSDTVAEDRVAGQSPEQGTEADEGSTVTIIGLQRAGRGARCRSCRACRPTRRPTSSATAGFKSEQRREFSDTVRNGRVIETSPPEGSTVRKGSVGDAGRVARQGEGAGARRSWAGRARRPSGSCATPAWRRR